MTRATRHGFLAGTRVCKHLVGRAAPIAQPLEPKVSVLGPASRRSSEGESLWRWTSSALLIDRSFFRYEQSFSGCDKQSANPLSFLACHTTAIVMSLLAMCALIARTILLTLNLSFGNGSIR